MSKIVKVKNNKISSDTWVGQTIEPGEYFVIPEAYIHRWVEDIKVFTDIGNGDLIVANSSYDYINPVEGYEYLEGEISDVETVSELVVTWSNIKTFFQANSGSYLNYIDLDDYYYIWLCYRQQKLYIPMLTKNTSDATDFETNFKLLCNIAQAPEARLSTCRYGRKLHSRYISFYTATTDGYNNDNYLDVDQGDVTYIMIDADRNVTTNESLCKETWIDFEPQYSLEIAGGDICIPATLPGDQDAWALHVIGAPDYPVQYGGSVQFIANPKLKWAKGSTVTEDESLNPVNIDYVPEYHYTKIRWIIKHPLGEQAEFQIHMRIYR